MVESIARFYAGSTVRPRGCWAARGPAWRMAVTVDLPQGVAENTTHHRTADDMADNPTTASLAAKLRAEIRAQIEAGLATPRPPVNPGPQAPARRTAVRVRQAASIRTIPMTAGRPELALPEGTSLPALLPSSLKAGVTVSYFGTNSMFGGAGGIGTGYVNANVNIAREGLVCIDVRRFLIANSIFSQAVSSGSGAVVGDEVSAGIFWVHPSLLQLVSGEQAPAQAERVQVERGAFDADGSTFNSVQISQETWQGSSTTVYDLDSGFLLRQDATLNGGVTHEELTYRSRRELQIPWAHHAAPAWVDEIPGLTFEGGNVIDLSGTVLRQAVTIFADFETLSVGSFFANVRSVTSSGFGYPEERNAWELVCAAAMLYPLWIAPAALKELRPDQLIDEDPSTGFKMTFTGIDGDYATIFEEGPLESTTYFFDMNDGMFMGFKGQRPFAGGGRVQTETWLKD